MDLSDFISTTLLSIRTGLQKANDQEKVKFVMDSVDNKVDFDIAVEVTQEKGSERGGGLKIKVIEGNIMGKNNTKELNVSRIKLSVKVGTRLE